MVTGALGMLLSLSVGQAEPGEYAMDNLGGAVVLPAGWELVSGGWSDDFFKSLKLNKHVDLKVWYTDYQAPVTPENAQAWAEQHREGFDRQGGVNNTRVASTEVITVAGRPTAAATITGEFKDGTAITARVYSFPAGGQTVHVRGMGNGQFASEIAADVQMIAETMKLNVGALEGERAVSVEGQFAATLPEGWRVPFDKELEKVKKLTAKMGEADLNPTKCFVGIHPVAAHDPDVLFACGTYLYVGPVDEHSFSGVETEVHAEFFGKAPAPVAAAVPVPVGDRMGFYFSPRDDLRLALAPYDQGMMMTWGADHHHGDSAALDAAMKATLASVTFTGPDGGAPIIAPDKWVSYYVRYRPTSPPVLLGGVVLLGVLGGIGFLATRGRKKTDLDLDDDI